MKSRKMKRMLAVMASVLLVAGLAGCSDGSSQGQGSTDASKEQSGTVKEDGDITIAVVPKALDNSVFIDTREGAETKGKELGINIEWVGSASSDASEQVSVIEGLIAKKVDGILVSVNDADALKDVIDRAADAGIKIACIDSDSPDSKRAFYCGTDNYEIGKVAGERLLELMPDGGKVGMLTGVLGVRNLEERINGFQDAVEGSDLELLPVQSCEDDVQKAVEILAQFTAANPDMKGWYIAGGWPYLSDPDALPDMKTFIQNGGKVVCIDAVYPMLRFVGMDMVSELVGQDFTAMGSEGVEALYKLIKGEEVTFEDGDIINTGYNIVDKSNWEDIQENATPW